MAKVDTPTVGKLGGSQLSLGLSVSLSLSSSPPLPLFPSLLLLLTHSPQKRNRRCREHINKAGLSTCTLESRRGRPGGSVG